MALPDLRRAERLGVIDILVTAVGNVGRWLVEWSDRCLERRQAPRPLVDQIRDAWKV